MPKMEISLLGPLELKCCMFVWTECVRTLSSDWKSGQGGGRGGDGGGGGIGETAEEKGVDIKEHGQYL